MCYDISFSTTIELVTDYLPDLVIDPQLGINYDMNLHAQAQAFPDGEPQERVLGFVYFLNKYGPALIDRLSDVLPGTPGTHYVVNV